MGRNYSRNDGGRMNQFVGLHIFNIILLSGQFNCFQNILAQVKMVLTKILYSLLLLFPFIHANPKLMKQNDPSADGDMELCPSIPSEINGKWMANKSIPTDWDELIQKYKMVETGGIWKGPKQCKARQRVALIIPYRERPEHLRALLNNLHPLLQKQQISYQIFMANQANPVNGIPDKFNRGKLINAAYAEIQRHFCMPPKGKKECWDCYIFHDVDLVPEDDRNLYRCGSEPIRLMSGTEEGQQNEYMGGVTAMSSEQFESVNGFSNNFWGWGSEDVNLRLRFDLINQSITFLKGPVGEFTTLELVKKADDKTNPTIRTECREELNRKVAETWKFDGLSNLEYKMLDIVEEMLYTNIRLIYSCH